MISMEPERVLQRKMGPNCSVQMLRLIQTCPHKLHAVATVQGASTTHWLDGVKIYAVTYFTFYIFNKFTLLCRNLFSLWHERVLLENSCLRSQIILTMTQCWKAVEEENFQGGLNTFYRRSKRPFSGCTCWQQPVVDVWVCLPLLLWVSNASRLWYLLTAIFEWCLLTVTACSEGQKWRLNQGDHSVCAGKKQSGHSVIQHDSGCRLKAGGPTLTITSQTIVCLLMCVCVWECGQVIKSALKSHWGFSPSNLQTKQYTTTTQLTTPHRYQAKNFSDCSFQFSSSAAVWALMY